MSTNFGWKACWITGSFCLIFSSIGCGSGLGASSQQCTATLTGTPWTPSVSGVTSTNHDSTVTLSQTSTTATGTLVGLAQGYSSKEISVSIDMTQDLGAYGSLTLMAQTTGFPSSLQGGAFAYLTSLSDGTNEYINLTSSCGTSGLYTCTSGVCSSNSLCAPSWPSAYISRTNWEQHQADSNSAINYPSVNTFPTCNWTGGTNQSATDPSCGFNTTFFPGGYSPARLRYGVTYTAKYVLVADHYASLNGYSAGLKVVVTKKTANRSSLTGAIDLNFVIVGTSNIQASRTTKGQQNLNTLASAVTGYYGQTNPNIKIGTIKAVEWPCSSGGDTYAKITTSNLSNMFSGASSILPSGTETKAMNIFLVSSITDDSAGSDSNLTILGVDGAIGGPIANGTAVSGMAVSTFDNLATYNTNCSSSATTCPLSQQDSSFHELTETVAHEGGHFLGLNHLSESSGTTHDFVRDTPVCTATQTVNTKAYLTINSCLNTDTNVFSGTGTTCNANCPSYSSTNGIFCPTATACEFNYIMWWTTKNFYNGNSDGDMFSAQESGIMNYHPLVQ